MKFGLKLFVLVGVFVGLCDVWGVEDAAAGFYVNKKVKKNEDLINAVKEKRVIKAVYRTETGGNVYIMSSDFTDNVSAVLECTVNGSGRKIVQNVPTKDCIGVGDYYMEKNVDYTFYFIFNNELLDSTASMFGGCKNLISVDFTFFNTKNVKAMLYMFSGCSALKELNLSNFSTQSVTNMQCMFSSCSALTKLDLSPFVTTSVIDMSGMFYNCTALKELDFSSFNTQSVTNMSHMFYKCSSLTRLDLSKFNTINVTFMRSMFDGCTSLEILDISNFDFSHVDNRENIFLGCNLKKLFFPKEHAKIRHKCLCCCVEYVCPDDKEFEGLNPNNVVFVGGVAG